jgi:hypothetical protein
MFKKMGDLLNIFLKFYLGEGTRVSQTLGM